MLRLLSFVFIGSFYIVTTAFSQSSEPSIEIVGANIEGGDCKAEGTEFEPIVEINGNGASVTFLFSNYKSVSTDINSSYSTCDFRTTFKFPEGITGTLTSVEYRGVASGLGTESQAGIAGITREYSWIGGRARDVRSDVFGFDQNRNASIMQTQAEEVQAPQFFNPRFFMLDQIRELVVAPCNQNEKTLIWNSILFTQEPLNAPANFPPTQIELTSVDVSSEVKLFIELRDCE